MGVLSKAGVILSVIDQSFKGTQSFVKNIKTIEARALNTVRSLSTMGTAMGKLFLPSVAAGGLAVKAFTGVEDSLNKLESVSTSVSGNLAADMKRTKDEAIRLSKAFSISAKDMIQASYNLASSGLNTEQTIGLMEGSAKLATAGLGELSQTTSLLGSIMNQFGSELQNQFTNPMEQGARIADLFAQTVKRSQTTLPELSEAMKYAGSVASGLNIPLNEVLSYIGTFQTYGLKGTIAGTTFSNMMLEMGKASKELGVDMKDSSGLMRSPIDIFKDISEKMEWVTDASGKLVLSQNSVNKVFELFNKRGGKGALIAIKQAKEMRNYARALDEGEGYADSMAKTIEKGLGSALKRSWNQIVNLSSAIGEKLTPTIIGFTDKLQKWIKTISRIDSDVIKNIATIIKWGVIIGAVGKAITLTIGAVSGLISVMSGLLTVGGAVFGALITVGGVLAGVVLSGLGPAIIVTAGLIALWKQIPNITKAMSGALDVLKHAFTENITPVKEANNVLTQHSNKLKEYIKVIEKAAQAGKTGVATVLDVKQTQSESEKIKEQIQAVVKEKDRMESKLKQVNKKGIFSFGFANTEKEYAKIYAYQNKLNKAEAELTKKLIANEKILKQTAQTADIYVALKTTNDNYSKSLNAVAERIQKVQTSTKSLFGEQVASLPVYNKTVKEVGRMRCQFFNIRGDLEEYKKKIKGLDLGKFPKITAELKRKERLYDVVTKKLNKYEKEVIKLGRQSKQFQIEFQTEMGFPIKQADIDAAMKTIQESLQTGLISGDPMAEVSKNLVANFEKAMMAAEFSIEGFSDTKLNKSVLLLNTAGQNFALEMEKASNTGKFEKVRQILATAQENAITATSQIPDKMKIAAQLTQQMKETLSGKFNAFDNLTKQLSEAKSITDQIMNLGRDRKLSILDMSKNEGDFKTSGKLLNELFQQSKEGIQLDPVSAYKQLQGLKTEIMNIRDISGDKGFGEGLLGKVENQMGKAYKQALNPSGELKKIQDAENLLQERKLQLLKDQRVEILKQIESMTQLIHLQKGKSEIKPMATSSGADTKKVDSVNKIESINRLKPVNMPVENKPVVSNKPSGLDKPLPTTNTNRIANYTNADSGTKPVDEIQDVNVKSNAEFLLNVVFGEGNEKNIDDLFSKMKDRYINSNLNKKVASESTGW